jgi:hypothetical protein
MAENFIHGRPMPARSQNISARPGPRVRLRATGPPVTAHAILTSNRVYKIHLQFEKVEGLR